jgi:peptide-methionine (S)-S-oxide reductase
MNRSIALLLFVWVFLACAPTPEGLPGNSAPKASTPPADLSQLSRATFAGGCFWCEEAVFEGIRGVAEVISGYSGGFTEQPTYESTGTGTTGHAEAIEVYYDSTQITFSDLLRVYFASIDPTQVNGQGPDRGSQYRSIVFYRNATEEALVRKMIEEMSASGRYNRPIAVEVMPFKKFWQAEAYHQDYVRQHPENPYVQHESIPRRKRTHAKVQDLLK